MMKEIKLLVNEDDDLTNYLVKKTDYSKNKVKSLLKYHKVMVNNRVVVKLPFKVFKGNSVIIDLEHKEDVPFEIIYEDDEILVVNKEAGLLTVATMYEHGNTLYHLVREYANKKHFLVFIVHRLDKDTSGIVMFAKSERIKHLYQDNWNELAIKRGYVAVVEGCLKHDGHIENLLYEESNTYVHSSKVGKKAITDYHVVKYNDKYTLLNIDIKTGRKNQIRVHMSEMGYPVVGDRKYGSKHNPFNRLCLHAYLLEIKHPITGEIQHFETKKIPIFQLLDS